MSSLAPPIETTGEALRDAVMLAFQSRFQFNGRRFVAAGGRGRGREMVAAGLTRNEWRTVAKEALALHEAYTKGRSEFAHAENPIHARPAGYQFYFLFRNVFRVRYVLDQLSWRSSAAQGRLELLSETTAAGPRLNVLDLGCGSGAFSLALLGWLCESRREGEALPRLRFVLVDQGHALLKLAEANVRALLARLLPETPVSVETRAEGVEAFLGATERRGTFGVIGAAMMLNEMNLLAPGRGGARAARFAEPVRRLAREGGLMVFVEPGTRKGYMQLMALRDRFEGLPILYPCTHGRPCPLWSPKVPSWCHATRPLPRPFGFDAELKEMGGMGFEMRELNLAALALQAVSGGAERQPFFHPGGGRVVSAILPGRAQKKSKHPLPPARGNKKEVPQPPAPSVVLCCGGDGRISEIPSAGLEAFPRGLWLPDAAIPPKQLAKPWERGIGKSQPHGTRAGGKKRRWAKKR